MREIKFRGRKSNGEWVYGNLVTAETIDGIPTKNEILPFDSVIFEATEEVEEDTIGQFTGLHDKNGKEIYEGDIIESDGYSGARHYVGYRKEEAMFVAYIIGTTPQDYCSVFQHWIDNYEKKVIGNIHDNPELLNE